MREYTHLSLFSGIGGHDIAAGWAGFTTVGQCEWADYPTKILEKHWPNVMRWRDIHTLNAENFYERTGLRTVDLVSGSPPCQPFSVAGKQRGKEDDRYLWPEMYRIVREIAPAWVLIEEVTGFIKMALDTALSDLENAGYASQSFVIPACGVNAPHLRERLCVVAHAIDGGCAMRRHRELQDAEIHGGCRDHNGGRKAAAIAGERRKDESRVDRMADGIRTEIHGGFDTDADSNRLQGRMHDQILHGGGVRFTPEKFSGIDAMGTDGANEPGIPGMDDGIPDWIYCAEHFWDAGEPEDLPRVKANVPNRAERIKALGNAIPPQQFYPFYSAIMEEIRKEESE